MKRFLTWAVTACAMVFPVTGCIAAEEEKSETLSIFPVDLWACAYHEGKGPADLDGWVGKFNDFFGEASPEGYSAWLATPYYFGPEQEFDFLWIGVARTALALGKGHDKYLGNAELIAEVREIAKCGAHLNFAAMTLKQPPESDSKTGALSFSDCKISEGKTWDDLNPALKAWAEYRTGHGSQAGLWIMWPAYGGGDADDYDFKYLAGYDNYAEWGADYDQYGKDGWKKAEELFEGLLDCDDARVYNVKELRDGITDEE